MQWWHWVLVGLALIGLEILTLGGLGNFYFLFFGIAALVVGVLVWLGLTEPVWLQWVLFAVSGIATLLVLQKPLRKKMPARTKQADLVDSMVGQVATLMEDIPAQAAGKAELHGSTWTVRNAGDTPLVKGQRSQVIRVDGLTLWIQAEPSIKEEQHVG
ncbi:MAG: NfeD family protein [Nitrospirota bacterium]|nr:NfeD family protein [Nitrospirota bacterium]